MAFFDFLRSKESWVRDFRCPVCPGHPRLSQLKEFDVLGFERLYSCGNCHKMWIWRYMGEEVYIKETQPNEAQRQSLYSSL